MPRTRLDKNANPLEVLLRGHITAGGGDLKTGAEKIGMCHSTLCRRLMNVQTLTLEELLRIGRRYHSPIEDIRAAIRY